MILAHILITSNVDEVTALPDAIAKNMSSFRSAFPEIEQKLFTNFSIKELLKAHFGDEVKRAFESLVPYAYKADLARYCIMYVYGGVYADIGIRCIRSWHRFNLNPNFEMSKCNQLYIFSDFGGQNPVDVVNGMFAASAGHPALAKAIEMVCKNVRNRYYGQSPLCPTGPTLFSNAIRAAGITSHCTWGESRWLLPHNKFTRLIGSWGLAKFNNRSDLIAERTHALYFQDELLAMRVKRGGGSLLELGLRGGNEYTKLWNERNVYK